MEIRPMQPSTKGPAQMFTGARLVRRHRRRYTAVMTWIVVPRLARLLEPWLYAPPR